MSAGTLSSPSVERVREALARAGVASEIIAEFVRKHTGFAIGGVAPVAQASLKFVDTGLAKYAGLWAAAGHPHTVFRLTYSELLRITGGTPVDVGCA